MILYRQYTVHRIQTHSMSHSYDFFWVMMFEMCTKIFVSSSFFVQFHYLLLFNDIFEGHSQIFLITRNDCKTSKKSFSHVFSFHFPPTYYITHKIRPVKMQLLCAHERKDVGDSSADSKETLINQFLKPLSQIISPTNHFPSSIPLYFD